MMIKALIVYMGFAILVSACGGCSDDGGLTVGADGSVEDGSHSIVELPAELQGSWVSNVCIADQDQSLSEAITFTGSTMTRALIRHTGSADCSDRFTISRNFVARVELPEGMSATDGASEMSIYYNRGYVTVSSETKVELQSQGTSLEDFFAPQEVADLGSLPISSFVDSEIVQSHYRINGDVLRIGRPPAHNDNVRQLLSPDVFTGAEYNRVIVEPGCAATGSANKTVSVLLIGNSLMNGVQADLERLLACGGYATDMATSNPGGYWLHQHLENPRTTTLIAQGFDLTLIQEQSRGIATHLPPYETINALKDKIEAAGSEMGFYQTWGYQNREIDLTNEILFGYEILAAEFNAPIVHIGRAWDYFYTSNTESPSFSLYRDYAHSTPQGKALIAFVLYAYLTGDSPVNLSSLSLSDSEALELQSIAWLTYQSNS